MRIALLGGTFNPIHYGHLLIAEDARETHHVDSVVFIPAGRPPHKKRPHTSPKDRLAMVKLAIQGNSHFSVNDWEIKQNRVVYTYQTLEHFRALWPKAKLFFILGSDSMAKVGEWVEAERLPKLCTFVAKERIAPFASHDIRRRVRRGKSIRYWVPDSVEQYIRRHQLYRQPE